MTDSQLERLKDACVIAGEGLQRAAEAFKAAFASFEAVAAAKALGVDLSRRDEYEKNREYEELLRRINELGTPCNLDDLAAMAVEFKDIPPPKKIPRPAKYLGPVNKANYTANRPPRVARSSCRVIKR